MSAKQYDLKIRQEVWMFCLQSNTYGLKIRLIGIDQEVFVYSNIISCSRLFAAKPLSWTSVHVLATTTKQPIKLEVGGGTGYEKTNKLAVKQTLFTIFFI